MAEWISISGSQCVGRESATGNDSEGDVHCVVFGDVEFGDVAQV